MLWKHQEKIVKFVMDRNGTTGTGIFAGMGSGKTRAALEILRLKGYRLVLVVVPKTLLDDGGWERQILTHYRELGINPPRVLVLSKGSVKAKAKALDEFCDGGETGLVLVNYDSVWRGELGAEVKRAPWDCVLLDEAHRIKAAGSRVSLFFSWFPKYSRAKRLALTGTPAPNSPLDVYGLFRFLEPSAFGTRYDAFQARYAVMGGFEGRQVVGYRNLTEMSRIIAKLSIQVRTEDVIDLPPVVHTDRFGYLTGDVKRLYADLSEQFIAAWKGSTVVSDNALLKLNRLRQICNGFLYEKDTKEGVLWLEAPKKLMLADVLDEIGLEERVVVFYQFQADLKTIQDSSGKRRVYALNGEKKQQNLWRDTPGAVLAVQTQAGSEGISLVETRYVVYFGHPFSLGVYEQSLARVNRPGQERGVTVVHLVVGASVDRSIYRALSNKRVVIDSVLNEYQGGMSDEPSDWS